MTDNDLPKINTIYFPDPQPSDFPDLETYEKAAASITRPENPSKNNLFAIPNDRVLACFHALVSAAQPLGMGYLQPGSQLPFSIENAKAWWDAALNRERDIASFDYVVGRPIKMSFTLATSDNWITNTRLYDRDQGTGAGERIIVGTSKR